MYHNTVYVLLYTQYTCTIDLSSLMQKAMTCFSATRHNFRTLFYGVL